MVRNFYRLQKYFRRFALRQNQSATETWLSSKCPCPACRRTFCILDVSPVVVKSWSWIFVSQYSVSLRIRIETSHCEKKMHFTLFSHFIALPFNHRVTIFKFLYFLVFILLIILLVFTAKNVINSNCSSFDYHFGGPLSSFSYFSSGYPRNQYWFDWSLIFLLFVFFFLLYLPSCRCIENR